MTPYHHELDGSRLDGSGPGSSGLDGSECPQVEIVLPVRNEERDLAPSVRRLCGHLRTGFPFTARVTIADNGSDDATWVVAQALCQEFVEVSAVRLDQPGRGRALRATWSASRADVLAYMDVDLSTDLNALLPLVAPLLSGHSDLAIGSRLARGSRVIRGPRREVISRCYNLLLHASLGTGFSDAQCGFKAIRREQALVLLPLTTDTGWFFDTELLVLAERAGLRVHEVPVDWIDDTDSRVDIAATALADLRGIVRLGGGLARGTIRVPLLREPSLRPAAQAERNTATRPGDRDLPRQIASFAAIGAASTAAYLLLYVLLRLTLPAQTANALSLLVTAVLNTAVNRRVTFRIHGRARAAHHQAKGLLAFAAGLALTSGALAGLHAAAVHPGVGLELSVLIAANLAATVLRFLLFRGWVFRSSFSSSSGPGRPISSLTVQPGPSPNGSSPPPEGPPADSAPPGPGPLGHPRPPWGASAATSGPRPGVQTREGAVR